MREIKRLKDFIYENGLVGGRFKLIGTQRAKKENKYNELEYAKEQLKKLYNIDYKRAFAYLKHDIEPENIFCPICGEIRKTTYRVELTCGKKDEKHHEYVQKYRLKKQKKTFQETYGVEHIFQTELFKKRYKETMLKNYGVDNPSKSNKIKSKKIKTSRKNYGVDYYTQTDEYKERVRKTNLEKYGVTNPFKLKFFKEKAKNTCLQKYGVEYYQQTEEYKIRVKKTNLRKYGSQNFFQSNIYKSRSTEFKEKAKKTNLKKYGAEHYTQSEEYKNRLPEIKEKVKKTTLNKYNIPYYKQAHLKNTHLLTKEYLEENFLDENRCIKLQEMMAFFNMKETACYRHMRENDIKINYKISGFDPNKPATLYYLLDQETGLYKIGITNKTIEERFPNADGSKRNMIILEQTYYENGYEALEAEQEILEAFSYCRCINESWPENWGGRTEFFKEDILLKESK